MLKYEDDLLWNYGSSVPLKSIIQSVTSPSALTYSGLLTTQSAFNQAVGQFNVLVVSIASGTITTPTNQDQILILNQGTGPLTINSVVTMAQRELLTLIFKNNILQYFY